MEHLDALRQHERLKTLLSSIHRSQALLDDACTGLRLQLAEFHAIVTEFLQHEDTSSEK